MFLKFAAISATWGKLGDRFVLSGYTEGLSSEEKIKAAAQIHDLSGIELLYPGDVDEKNVKNVEQLLEVSNLKLAALGTSVSTQARWKYGAFTARDPQTRRAAIENIKAGMDVCAELGGDRIFFFFGQDGCDYSFQVDYEDAWNWLKEGLQEIADFRPELRICIEYKLNEPRRHIFVNSMGTALLLVKEVERKNVGVLLDMGHALYAGENLGESILLLSKYGKLFHTHFNDNYGSWDDDLIVGSVHMWPFLEALYWLRRVNYEGWCSIDVHPFREDPTAAVSQSINFLKNLSKALDKVGMSEMTRLIRSGNLAETMLVIHHTVFGSI